MSLHTDQRIIYAEIMAELAKCGEMSRQIDANIAEIIRLRKEYEAREINLCPTTPKSNYTTSGRN